MTLKRKSAGDKFNGLRAPNKKINSAFTATEGYILLDPRW